MLSSTHMPVIGNANTPHFNFTENCTLAAVSLNALTSLERRERTMFFVQIF
jgi:hypothetical protein